MAKVTFDGDNRIIQVNNGITSLDAQIDLYSDWKEWVVQGTNSRYAIAMSTIGGEPLAGGSSIGATFFLENGWKIRPFDGDHTLLIVGNLFTRDGGAAILPTVGNYTVNVEFRNSSLVTGVAPPSEIAQNVWTRPMFGESYTDKSAGAYLATLLGLAKHNFVMENNQFDSEGRLVSSDLKLFFDRYEYGLGNPPSRAYKMSANFDSDGRLTHYSVMEND